eukprot:SAG25_NODE_32_length_20323_cov_59.467721_7_plen_68_part_00
MSTPPQNYLFFVHTSLVGPSRITMACELGDNSISIANLESPDDEIEVAKLHGHEGAVRALLWLHEKD